MRSWTKHDRNLYFSIHCVTDRLYSIFFCFPFESIALQRFNEIYFNWDFLTDSMALIQNNLSRVKLKVTYCIISDTNVRWAEWFRNIRVRRVLGHSLVRLLVRSHRLLIRLLRNARFARALRCAHSFAHSLIPELVEKWMITCLETTWFCPTVQWTIVVSRKPVICLSYPRELCYRRLPMRYGPKPNKNTAKIQYFSFKTFQTRALF